MKFVKRMLTAAYVSATPGHDFGTCPSSIALCTFHNIGSHDEMVEAMNRLKCWLR